MISKSALLAMLPVYQNNVEVIKQRQGTDDIMDEIHNAHGIFADDYAMIYQVFDTGDIRKTCQKLWDWCKLNLEYTVEPGKEQTTKSPAGILQDEQRIDCKHYSLFIAGVLDAIKENRPGNGVWDWCFRFASYSNDATPAHVFVVVFYYDEEIWIDPVLDRFNEHKQPKFFEDWIPMALYRISGVEDYKGYPLDITVDKVAAEQSFLAMVNWNCYGLRDMLNNAPDILNGKVREYFNAQGFDFNQLLLILKSTNGN
ncbi:MAG: hypothetical protein ABW007_02130 [Chitinophagaceae bacterium]